MENQTSILIQVGIIWFSMCGIIVAAVLFYFKYRKNLFEKERVIKQQERDKEIAGFKAAAEAEENQKVKIATDLHDEVIPLLTTIVQNVNSNMRDFEKGDLILDNLARDRDTAKQLIDTVRSIALDLIPDVLINLGLERAIIAFVKKLNSDNCTVIVEKDSDFETTALFQKTDEANIYRLCLEIINNLCKHDPFTYMKIVLSFQDNCFTIRFIHDGNGVTNGEIANYKEHSKGFGLKSLQSRALILNASINYTRTEESASITVVVPVSL